MKETTLYESPIFEIRNLRVTYGFRRAVDDLSLSLESNQSLGILGLNGAGKSSTLRVLLGMQRARAGTVRLFGERPGSLRSLRALGYAPEDGTPPDYLTAEEYLRFVGNFRIGDRKTLKSQVGELLDWFELTGKKKIRDYSKGMRRRIVLAQAFLGNPRLLILDEPLNGLDPLMIIKLRDRLHLYMTGGGTVVFSSHILAEVEKTCSRVAILDKGQLQLSATLGEVVTEFGSVENAFAKKVGNS
jgi:ABC-2 type transport system ATP-binding protein